MEIIVQGIQFLPYRFQIVPVSGAERLPLQSEVLYFFQILFCSVLGCQSGSLRLQGLSDLDQVYQQIVGDNRNIAEHGHEVHFIIGVDVSAASVTGGDQSQLSHSPQGLPQRGTADTQGLTQVPFIWQLIPRLHASGLDLLKKIIKNLVAIVLFFNDMLHTQTPRFLRLLNWYRCLTNFHCNETQKKVNSFPMYTQKFQKAAGFFVIVHICKG